MHELIQAIPDAEVLVNLESEELGAKLLFLLRKRSFPNNIFNPATLNAELWSQSHLPGQQPFYPRNRQREIDLALWETWARLEAQNLILVDPENEHYRRLSRRPSGLRARMFPKQALHPKITDKVWMAFMREPAEQFTQARMTYQLRRLRLHGLIERIPKTHRYRLTRFGFRVAVFCTRTYARILRPCLGLALPATSSFPGPLRRSFDKLEQEVNTWVDQARLAA